MNRTSWTVVALLIAAIVLPLGCVAQTTMPAPTTQPTTMAASQPTTGPASTADAKVMATLKALEATGRNLTAKADIDYTVRSVTLGDKEVRTGFVLYDAAKGDRSARFRIHFDTRKEGDGPAVKDLLDYAFDGYWMSIARHAEKKLQQIQVAAQGQKVEPLRLGKGPFPIPFGQKVDDVLEFFDVTTREPKSDDPANTIYLKLVLKPGKANQSNFTEIEEWIDKDLNLPVKLIAREKNKTVSTVLFGTRKDGKVTMDTKAKVDDADFKFSKPLGWTLEINNLEKK